MKLRWLRLLRKEKKECVIYPKTSGTKLNIMKKESQRPLFCGEQKLSCQQPRPRGEKEETKGVRLQTPIFFFVLYPSPPFFSPPSSVFKSSIRINSPLICPTDQVSIYVSIDFQLFFFFCRFFWFKSPDFMRRVNPTWTAG